MTIVYTEGDLLKKYKAGECDAIAHCANCQGVMGSGIALQIKNELPAAYDAYKNHESLNCGLELSTVSYAEIDHGFIFNLHAQNLYGYDGSRYVNYESIYETLRKTKEIMLENDLISLGVPYKMACDRAGGDWRIIEAMLTVIFENTDIQILIVKYNPNV